MKKKNDSKRKMIPRILKFFEISDITFEKSKGTFLYKRYIVSIYFHANFLSYTSYV